MNYLRVREPVNIMLKRVALIVASLDVITLKTICPVQMTTIAVVAAKRK